MATRNSIAPFPTDINRDYFGAWLSGFADGEGCFHLRQDHRKFSHLKNKIFVSSGVFEITLRLDDFSILCTIQSFLGCGNLTVRNRVHVGMKDPKPVMSFRVQAIRDLESSVIPHFDKYPLMAKKRHDFEIWKTGILLCSSIKRRKRKVLPKATGWGTLPKWTEEENLLFASYVASLKGQRVYCDPESITKPKMGSRKFC